MTINVTYEGFISDLKRINEGKLGRMTKRSGLSITDIHRFIKGERPTKEEFVKLHRFLPNLKRYTMLFKDTSNRRIVTPKSGNGSDTEKPVSQTKTVTKTVTHADLAKDLEKAVIPKVKMVVKAEKKMPPVKIQEATPTSHLSIPSSPIQITGSSEGQYTRIEEIDPSLAELLLKGNVRNRNVSPLLVDSIARDILAGEWIQSHQGIALDKDARLLDGQHRLLAIVKSGATIKIPVTYNVRPEAFNVIDLNNRPRSISDIVRLDRGVRYARQVIAAVKTLHSIKSDNVDHRRWTKSEVDQLLDLYSADCEWAASMVSKSLTSSGVIAGIAYAYPTDKEGVGKFAQACASRLGMTTPMTALWNAYERTGRSEPERMELTYMTLRCIWAHQKDEKLLRTAVTKGSGPGRGIAYRHFRHLRLKLGLPE